MPIDDDIKNPYETPNTRREEPELVDARGQLTPIGINYIEQDLDFKKLLKECSPLAIETYNRLHPAAKEYIDKTYWMEMICLRQHKIARKLFT